MSSWTSILQTMLVLATAKELAQNILSVPQRSLRPFSEPIDTDWKNQGSRLEVFAGSQRNHLLDFCNDIPVSINWF